MNAIRNKSVLVIEDDPALLRAISRVLTAEGAIVASMERPEQGLELLAKRQGPTDLVITDLRMPEMTGITVVHAVRNMFPSMPVVVVTAFASPELRIVCLNEGAFAFLEKPLSSEQLLAVANRAFNGGVDASPPS